MRQKYISRHLQVAESRVRYNMNVPGIGLLVLLAASCVTCGGFPRSRRGVDQGATRGASNNEAAKTMEATENKVEEQPRESRQDNGGICSLLAPLANLAQKVVAMFPVVGPFLKKSVSFVEKMLCNRNAGIA
ncbi:hypothetical protein ISCGN_029185 [Ixodes scapularis]